MAARAFTAHAAAVLPAEPAPVAVQERGRRLCDREQKRRRVQSVPLYVSLGAVKLLHHCWHDINVRYPGGPVKTVDSPTEDGRVCLGLAVEV